jgi:hypothetical protein
MTEPASQAADDLSAADIDYLLNDSEGQELLSRTVSDFLNDGDEDTEDDE